MLNKKGVLDITRQHGDLAIAAASIYLAEKGLDVPSQIGYVGAITSGFFEDFFTTYNSPQFSHCSFIPKVMVSTLHGGVRVARTTSFLLGATYDPLFYVPFLISEGVRAQTRKLNNLSDSINDVVDDEKKND